MSRVPSPHPILPLLFALGLFVDGPSQGGETEAKPPGDSVREEDQLWDRLSDPDWLVRRYAIGELGDLGGPRAYEALIAALEDEHPKVRESAASTLGRLNDSRAVEPLIQALEKADDRAETIALIRSLASLGDPLAVQPIVETLSREDARISPYVVRDIICFKDPRIADFLYEKARDSDGNLSFNTVHMLIDMEDSRVYDLLVEGLQQPSQRNRSRAARALGGLGDPRAVEPLIAALSSEPGSLREDAAEALGRIGGERAVGPLVQRLKEPEEEADVYEGVLSALGRLADAEVESDVKPFTKHEHKDVREVAEEAIANIRLGAFRAWRCEGESEALEVAEEGLAANEPELRLAAIRVLREMDGEKTLPLLATRRDDPDPDVRIRAVFALESIESPTSTNALAEFVHDSDEMVRRRAIEALGERRDPRAVEILLEWVGSTNRHQRKTAAELLKGMESPETIEALCRLLEDPDFWVRKEVVGTLRSVTDQRFLQPLLAALGSEEDGSMRAEIVGALSEYDDPRAVEALEKALGSDNVQVCNRAAKCLAGLGWKPTNRAQRIRYMICTGRIEEASALIPQAQPVGEDHRLEGKFEIGIPILTRLSVGVNRDSIEWGGVVSFQRIEFQVTDSHVGAFLMLNSRYPDTTWIIRVDLIGADGTVLSFDEVEYKTRGGVISGIRPLTLPHSVHFTFPDATSPEAIERFAISLRQTIPGRPSYEWFHNPETGHDYCLTDPMKWDEARLDAERVGEQLATVNNPSENSWLADTFKDSDRLFIGLTDREEEGVWKWVSGEESDYRNWMRRQPRDSDGSEDFVELYPRGKWRSIGPQMDGRGIVERDGTPEVPKQ